IDLTDSPRRRIHRLPGLELIVDCGVVGQRLAVEVARVPEEEDGLLGGLGIVRKGSWGRRCWRGRLQFSQPVAQVGVVADEIEQRRGPGRIDIAATAERLGELDELVDLGLIRRRSRRGCALSGQDRSWYQSQRGRSADADEQAPPVE